MSKLCKYTSAISAAIVLFLGSALGVSSVNAAPDSFIFCVNKTSKAVTNRTSCVKNESKIVISATGAAGASAYELWLAAGNAGSIGDFLTSLKGKQGLPGSDGSSASDGIMGGISSRMTCAEKWQFAKDHAPLLVGDLLTNNLGNIVIGCSYQGPFSAQPVNGVQFNPTQVLAIVAKKELITAERDDPLDCTNYNSSAPGRTTETLFNYNAMYCDSFAQIPDTNIEDLYRGLLQVKMTFSNLPTGWRLCRSTDDQAFSIKSRLFEVTGNGKASVYEYTNFGISYVNARAGEGLGAMNDFEITEAGGGFFMGSREIPMSQSVKPVWYWYATFCGPDPSTRSGKGYRILSGANALRSFSEFTVAPLVYEW